MHFTMYKVTRSRHWSHKIMMEGSINNRDQLPPIAVSLKYMNKTTAIIKLVMSCYKQLQTILGIQY